MSEEKIDAIILLEIMGNSANYLTKILEEIIERISKEQGVTIIDKKIAEPKELEKQKGLFSSFAELELTVVNLKTFSMLVFAYMPSHVEITNPESLIMKNYDINVFFNELVRMLHQYDELAKIAIIERDMMLKQIQHLKQKIGVEEISEEKIVEKKSRKKKVKI